MHANSFLRIAIGFIMVAHGIARLSLSTVNELGEFLDNKGLPAGIFFAWMITLIEITGGFILASGHLVRLICLWFILQQIFAIVLLHAANGWFVVDAQTGGMEYSSLLIICLIVIAAHHKKNIKPA